MIKHTNPSTPINTQRDTKTNRHTHAHAHTCMHTQTHKLRPTAPIRQRHGRAPRPKARKKPPWGPTTLRGLLGTTTGSAATETVPTRADKRPHTKVPSPPAIRARAFHRTAPPIVNLTCVKLQYHKLVYFKCCAFFCQDVIFLFSFFYSLVPYWKRIDTSFLD